MHLWLLPSVARRPTVPCWLALTSFSAWIEWSHKIINLSLFLNSTGKLNTDDYYCATHSPVGLFVFSV